MCGCNLQQFKIKVMMRLEICSLATLVSSNLSSFVFQTVNFDLIAFYNPMSKYGLSLTGICRILFRLPNNDVVWSCSRSFGWVS